MTLNLNDNAGAPAPIGRILDASPLSRLQLVVAVVCALSVLLDGYDLQVMALTVPAVARAWALPPAAFSVPLAAALAGMGLGSAVIGPLGDRCGRRPLLIGAMIVLGVATLCTATASSTAALSLWRAIAGTALGTSLPNAYALTSDYAPRRLRSRLVTLMFCNTATGALLGALAAPYILRHGGWQAAFVIGGVLPLLLAVLMFAVIPESLRYLLEHRPEDRRLARILAQVAPGVAVAAVQRGAPAPTRAIAVAALFRPGLRRGTLLMWVVYSLNSFNLYLLVSWLPALLVQSGQTQAGALHGASLIQLGGLAGAFVLAWCMDRMWPTRVMSLSFALTAAAFLSFRALPQVAGLWTPLLLLIGAGTGGAQFALAAVSAVLYPPGILATGVGWTAAVARVGAVASPLVGGWLMVRGVAPLNVIGLLAVPACLCALLVLPVLPRGLPQSVE